MKTRDVMINVLAVIGMGLIDAIELSLTIASSPYGSSYNELQRNSGRIYGSSSGGFSEEDSKRAQKKRYNNLVYKLKQQGLLEEVMKGEKKFFRLTLEGKRKLAKSKENPSLPPTHYTKEKDERFVIVMFDIPEKDRKKRAWLRAVLVNLGFSMAQKSVWIGKVRIPQALIDDLVTLNLDNFVEIFQVTKTGNLKHVI